MPRAALLSLLVMSLVGCGRVSYRARDAGPDGASFDAADDALWMMPMEDARLPLDARDVGFDAGFDGGTDAAHDAPMRPDVHITPEAPCPVEALFCDGYEDGVFAPWSFSVTRGGSVSSLTTRANRGSRSMRCVSDGGDAIEARYSVRAFGGQTAGDIWARAYFYLPAAVPPQSLIALTDSAPPYMSVGLMIDGTRIGVASAITGLAVFDDESIPLERWVCLELHVFADPTAGFLEAYRDGVRGAASFDFNTVPDTGYEVAEIGIHYVPTGPAFELYVDDVVLSNTRIGCL